MSDHLALDLLATPVWIVSLGDDAVVYRNRAAELLSAGLELDDLRNGSHSAHAEEQLAACLPALRAREQALRESEQRFRDYSAVASDWFWETDADMRFTAYAGLEQGNWFADSAITYSVNDNSSTRYIVGTEAQAAYLVHVFPLGRYHQDGDFLFLADAAADLEAVHPGHHDVQQHHVGLELVELFKAFFAVVGRRDLIALLGQVEPQQLADVGIVVHDEDRLHAFAPGQIFPWTFKTCFAR